MSPSRSPSGPGQSDPVLLLHATGFHSRCWDSIARELPGVHIYAVDARFHGGSDRHGEVNWLQMAGDMEALLERLDLRRVIGVGHSLGGYLTAWVAARQVQRFRQLVLIDPVILPRQRYLLFPPRDTVNPADSPVSRRKNRWQDAGEMYARFRNRPPFASWQDQVLRDYCEYALRQVPQETALQLACDPLHEAAIYLNHQGNEAIYELLPQLTIPVTVLRAPPDPRQPGQPGGIAHLAGPRGFPAQRQGHLSARALPLHSHGRPRAGGAHYPRGPGRGLDRA